MDLLRIDNEGPLITATNYWAIPPRRGEVCYLSTNAGAFRLLLRPEALAALADMRTALECVVSRGPWTSMGLADGLEILFDDGSADPFALHLQVESADRLPLDSDAGREWILTVWGPGAGEAPALLLERPCWYRRVPRIPWLRPRA